MTMSTIKRLITATAVVVMAAFVSGCGGGGAGGQGGAGSGGGGGATEASALTLITSVPSIGSDGKTVATITAFVKDSGNRALANQFVDFSTTDNGAVITGGAVLRTDETGSASATLAITEPTNRVITLVAKSGSLTSTLGVSVVGTALTLDGPTNLVSNESTEFTVALRNSAGDPIASKPVSVASSAGNTLSQATVTTDSAGRAKFQVIGTKAGADTLKVDALGATASLSVAVASTQLSFVVPTPSQELAVDTPHVVTVAYQVGGVPQVGRPVEFFSTRGTITASATTGADGRASATISALTAGVSTITARADGIEGRQGVEFVSRVPAKISVQSSPTNVGVNLTQSSTNSSQLIAVVKDANDNPVKGQLVVFSEVVDPSNGRIEPPSATTDSSGVASVAFFPGANATGEKGIVLRATLYGTGITGTTELTASRQELDVSIGTGNVLEDLDEVNYGMPWDALVTDAAGNGVPNATVQASLVGVAFYKGRYYPGLEYWYPGGDSSSKPPFKCISEDANGNLRLDAGEDTNGDGELTPSNVAAVEVLAVGGRTDSSGFARIRIKYPKQYANWARVRLTVTTTVIAGTEGTATSEFVLPVIRDHVKLDQTPPGGIDSAFGVIGDCSTTN